MCDFDGNYCRAWNEKVRTARRAHTCCACREPIKAGERYHFLSGVWSDSGPDSFKHCLRCWVMYRAAAKRARENGDDGAEILLDCGVIWENPPPEIEALAFALPGEVVL
jgi:hypothetical protein